MHIVITGASRGIGRATANLFASKGYSLWLSARQPEALSNTVTALRTQYPGIAVEAKAFDISQQDQAKALGNWVVQEGIVPDVLVNNAGFFEPGNVHDEKDGILESQLAVNLLSAYHLTRTLLPGMMKNKSGHIFNMCSVASMAAYKNGGAYSISKFALLGFSKNLREEMKPFHIKVTAVLPGAVMTDSWAGFDNRSQRIMEATDVAALIYAASQLSPQACVEEIILRPQLGDL